jgi:hypothetical protein
MHENPATPDFSRALPDRPVTVRPPATIGPMSACGLFTLLFGLLAGAVWWLGPDLVRDWRVGGEVVEAQGARIEEQRCRSRLMVFNVCDVTFVAGSGASEQRQTLWYFFIDRLERGPIVLVQPKRAPGGDARETTTDLGLDRLYPRLLAFALIVGMIAICIALSVQVLRQGMATRRALLALSGQALHPVIVGLEGNIPIAHKRRRWTYVYEEGGRQERAFIELAKGVDPLFVTPDGKRALALAGPGGGVPLLLDKELSALDLTEAEREAFFAACRKALGNETER